MISDLRPFSSPLCKALSWILILVFLAVSIPFRKTGVCDGKNRLVILNLDPVLIEVEDTRKVSMSLRDAFLIDGRFEVLSEITMVNRLTGDSTRADMLKKAREEFSMGKKLLSSGMTKDACKKLKNALNIHSDLYSEILRKEEMADVYLNAGLCAFKSGDKAVAKENFIEAILLSPGIAGDSPSISDEARGVFEEALKDVQSRTTRRIITGKYASTLSNRCGVDLLLWGFCAKREDGITIHLRLFKSDGSLVTTIEKSYPTLEQAMMVDNLLSLVEGCANPLGLPPLPPQPSIAIEETIEKEIGIAPPPREAKIEKVEKEVDTGEFFVPLAKDEESKVKDIDEEVKDEVSLKLEETEAEVDPYAVEKSLKEREYKKIGEIKEEKRYRYGMPQPWFKKWWIWAIAGSVGLSLGIGIPLANPKRVYIYGESSYEITVNP